MTVGSRWTVEQVAAVAPGPTAFHAAEVFVDPGSWLAAGADERVLWGRCRGSGGEPYEVAVEHVEVAFRCTCPSRRIPCKHALGLLLRWARLDLPRGVAPTDVARWAERAARSAADAGSSQADGETTSGTIDSEAPSGSSTNETASGSSGEDHSSDSSDDVASPTDPGDRDGGRNERLERARAGLVELDRWLEDRLRTGLSDPSMASYATWDGLAARLVDARAGSLANRIRRLAGVVGSRPDWHDHVLAEIGVLHLLASAGLRPGDLPDALADAVATVTGWQVRQADVLSGVPETDDWIVAGRSDTREDRIEVRRTWLRGVTSRRWAMVLSFAAYRQSLDTSLEVGTVVTADLHRYPGGAAGSMRALVGERTLTLDATSAGSPGLYSATIVDGCDEIGRMLAVEPWSERVPVTVSAAPAPSGDGWVLTDHTGSIPLDLAGSGDHAHAVLLAATAGSPAPLTLEWTPDGAVPLTIHLPDRVLDIGPVADPGFVATA